ncbi:MAG: IclR family transcriptional regulator [Janthinobacterium lividum]
MPRRARGDGQTRPADAAAIPDAGVGKAGDGKDRQFVTALARGLEILSCFGARSEIGGTQVAAMTGLPQPTVWRLCYTMQQLGFLTAAIGSDKLRPGLPLLKLGRAALASMPLAEAARPRMQALADRFGSATGLAARDGDRMVFVQRCLSDAALVMNLRVGARLPLAISSVGWGLLAGFPAAERDTMVARHAAADPSWPEARPHFEAAMAGYERSGFILNLGVFRPGYNGAAVPILDASGRPAFALSCAGAATSHTSALLRREIGPALLELGASLQGGLEG